VYKFIHLFYKQSYFDAREAVQSVCYNLSLNKTLNVKGWQEKQTPTYPAVLLSVVVTRS